MCTGGDSCCTPDSVCGVGEGDCDSNNDCSEGLVCGKDNCQGVGFDATDDCCAPPGIYTFNMQRDAHIHFIVYNLLAVVKNLNIFIIL